MIILLNPIKFNYIFFYTPPSDEHNNKLSSIRLVSFISLVISAFGWKPNTYGYVSNGNYLICSKISSRDSNIGTLYSGNPKL